MGVHVILIPSESCQICMKSARVTAILEQQDPVSSYSWLLALRYWA